MSDNAAIPDLKQFRIERKDSGLVHLVFDAPGRTMNVLSNAAIHELRSFSQWLAEAEVGGVVIRSGKATAFCAGADLNELGVAYDLVMAAPPRARFNTAFDHFFSLSAAIRALETSGKPIVAVIDGLALGGGCELAMGAHHRILTDAPGAALGLPESLVGLIPGSGGTQRLPRLIGLAAALPLLLDGARLSGVAAVEAGAVNQLVERGQEIAAAEKWLLAGGVAQQPWDRPEWTPATVAEVHALIEPVRARVLAETLGHYPAPLAVLDCVQFGLPQAMDGAIRTEMAIFSDLIQRCEPRNMIQSLFHGKTEYDRRVRRGDLPAFVTPLLAAVRAVLSANAAQHAALAAVGFSGVGSANPVRSRAAPGYWVEGNLSDPICGAARAVLDEISEAAEPFAVGASAAERRLADYAVISETGYPAYLGGPLTLRR